MMIGRLQWHRRFWFPMAQNIDLELPKPFVHFTGTLRHGLAARQQ